MTKDQATKMAGTEWWKDMDAREIVAFQLYEPLLCMDFGDFHGAVEEALGRPVWTHEFANTDQIKAEFEGTADPLTLVQIMELIPEEKRIVIVT